MVLTEFTSHIFSLLSYTPLQYMLRAMKAGSAPAAAYADKADDPSVCLVSEGHSMFVGGDALSPAADEAMNFLARILLAPERRRALEAVRIAFPHEAWKKKLAGALKDARVNEYMRCVFVHHAPGSATDASAPHIRPITEDMKALGNFDMIREEVNSTLGSVEAFLNRGFGYALVLEGRVCGFCTAEYLSEKECAIGIAVEEEYRQRGYASQMTASFLGECARRGLMPYWECWKNNIPSAKTAERAGFEKLADYPVLLAEFTALPV